MLPTWNSFIDIIDKTKPKILIKVLHSAFVRILGLA